MQQIGRPYGFSRTVLINIDMLKLASNYCDTKDVRSPLSDFLAKVRPWIFDDFDGEFPSDDGPGGTGILRLPKPPNSGGFFNKVRQLVGKMYNEIIGTRSLPTAPILMLQVAEPPVAKQNNFPFVIKSSSELLDMPEYH
jgi:hypothetical protein